MTDIFQTFDTAAGYTYAEDTEAAADTTATEEREVVTAQPRAKGGLRPAALKWGKYGK